MSEVKHIQIKDLLPEFQITQKYVDTDGDEIKASTSKMITSNGAYKEIPPVMESYLIIGYQIDKGAQQGLNEQEEVKIPSVNHHHQVTFIYQKINQLHLRQVITDKYEQLVVPEEGAMSLIQIDLKNTHQEGPKLKSKISSSIEDAIHPKFTALSIQGTKSTGVRGATNSS